MMLASLSNDTKRFIDLTGAGVTAVAGTVGALTLADWALVSTIAAAAFSAAWQLMRFYDRFRYGPDKMRGGDD